MWLPASSRAEQPPSTGGDPQGGRTLRTPLDRLLRFGSFELDALTRELRRDGALLAIRPKPLELLCYLAAQHRRVISRDELVREVWGGLSVSEGSLSTAIHELRRVLAGCPEHRIATFRRRGYRFLGPVTVVSSHAAEESARTIACAPVGRRRELRQAAEALHAVASGAQRTLVISGPAGIGKSRLLDAIEREAALRGLEVFRARAAGEAGGPALWPWIQIARALAERRGFSAVSALGDAARAKLRALAPELTAQSSAGDTAQPTADYDRFRVFDLLASFLQVEGERMPMILMLDELESSDPSSLALFSFLAGYSRLAGVLLIGACRDPALDPSDERRRQLEELAQPSFAERIALAAFEPDVVRSLLAETLGQQPSPALFAWTVDVTGGEPGFVAALLDFLRQEPAQQHEPVLTPALREGLGELAQRRLSCASSECRELLEIAALVGRAWPLALVREVLGFSEPRFMHALELAEQARWIAPQRPGVFRFVQSFVPPWLCRRATATRRLRIHRAIGDALARKHRDNPLAPYAILAKHVARAASLGRAAEAVHYARLAAERSTARGAYEEAARALQLALRASAWLDPPDPALRGALREQQRECVRRCDAPWRRPSAQAASPRQCTSDGLSPALQASSHHADNSMTGSLRPKR